MYTHYFGLNDKPFAIAPNPRYLFMSELHREALAHLIYGIQRDGCFILLTGDVGAGKTTVSRLLANSLGYRYIDTGALYRGIAVAVNDRRIGIESSADGFCHDHDIGNDP